MKSLWVQDAIKEWKDAHPSCFVWVSGKEINLASKESKQAKLIPISTEQTSKSDFVHWIKKQLDQALRELV